jgi:hypothetical protein
VTGITATMVVIGLLLIVGPAQVKEVRFLIASQRTADVLPFELPGRIVFSGMDDPPGFGAVSHGER